LNHSLNGLGLGLGLVHTLSLDSLTTSGGGGEHVDVDVGDCLCCRHDKHLTTIPCQPSKFLLISASERYLAACDHKEVFVFDFSPQ
jgi:hypothetical protein